MARVEQRRDERYPVVYDVAVSSGGKTVWGKTLNLSLGGVRVFIHRVLPRVNEEVYASILLPGAGRTEASARVVWAARDQLGLVFTGPVHPRLLAFTALQECPFEPR